MFKNITIGFFIISAILGLVAFILVLVNKSNCNKGVEYYTAQEQCQKNGYDIIDQFCNEPVSAQLSEDRNVIRDNVNQLCRDICQPPQEGTPVPDGTIQACRHTESKYNDLCKTLCTSKVKIPEIAIWYPCGVNKDINF
jgi:hypothetical protein